MRVALGCDHAGFHLKEVVAAHLAEKGFEVQDLGTFSDDPVDYPWFCANAALAVVEGAADRAVVLGGTGQGENISANKVRGARAALCHDETTARLARAHNDANVLSLGARILGPDLALAIVDVFFSTEFDGGRHARRLAEVADIEAEEHDRAS
jgi:ribose 5-phosphate isomerase B